MSSARLSLGVPDAFVVHGVRLGSAQATALSTSGVSVGSFEDADFAACVCAVCLSCWQPLRFKHLSRFGDMLIEKTECILSGLSYLRLNNFRRQPRTWMSTWPSRMSLLCWKCWGNRHPMPRPHLSSER